MDQRNALMHGQLAGLGELKALQPAQVKALVNAVQCAGGEQAAKQAASGPLLVPTQFDKGFREQAIARSVWLPGAVREQVKDNSMQIRDYVLSTYRTAGSNTTIELFKQDDSADAGRNVEFGKLRDNSWFLVCGVQLLTGVGATWDVTNYGASVDSNEAAGTAKTIRNGGLDTQVANGRFTFRIDKSTVVEDFPSMIFNKIDDKMGSGYVELDSPLWIGSGQRVQFDLELNAAAATNTQIRLLLWGAMVS